jgi:selenocysteine-specific translation elongation factor
VGHSGTLAHRLDLGRFLEYALDAALLERPIAAAAGDRVLRDTSAQRTNGGGRFIDLNAPVVQFFHSLCTRARLL